MTFSVLIYCTCEEGVEPEVDLSSFLERQRLSPQPSSAPPPPEEDEDIDTSLAHLVPRQSRAAQSKKGKAQQIEWDAGLEELSREKAAAEAKWGKGHHYSTLSSSLSRCTCNRSQGSLPRSNRKAARQIQHAGIKYLSEKGAR